MSIDTHLNTLFTPDEILGMQISNLLDYGYSRLDVTQALDITEAEVENFSDELDLEYIKSDLVEFKGVGHG